MTNHRKFTMHHSLNLVPQKINFQINGHVTCEILTTLCRKLVNY